MEEVFKRENDKMVKLVHHDEQLLTNQEVYNHWGKLCAKEAQLNSDIRRIQAQLDQVRQCKKDMREIAKDCEKRIPKQEKVDEIKIIDMGQEE